jgi:hypothetical protein
MLLAVTAPRKGSKDIKKLFKMSEEVMKKADIARDSILHSPPLAVKSPRVA